MARRFKRSEEWWVNHPEVVRCTAHYKSNGLRCTAEAHPGTNVCTTHGALAPQVQAAAAVRIQMSVDDAVKRLHAMLDDPDVDARDKIKILHDLLDRGGLGATQKHVVGVGKLDPVEQLFQDLLTTPGALLDPAQMQPAPVLPDPVQAALDAAEEVPDWDTFRGSQNGVEGLDDVVEGEVVAECSGARALPAAAPLHERRTDSARTPKHIREALEELL